MASWGFRGAVFPVTGLSRMVMGWSDDEAGSEGLFIAGIVLGSQEAQDRLAEPLPRLCFVGPPNDVRGRLRGQRFQTDG